MYSLVEHEMDPKTPKNEDSMVQRLANSHLSGKTVQTEPHSQATLRSEAAVTIMGGFIDMANIFPYGTFKVAQDPKLQKALYEELKDVWPNHFTPIPSYEVLRHLPYLVSNFFTFFVNVSLIYNLAI